MGRKKSEIQADITKQKRLITENTTKINALKAALSALDKADIKVKWVEESHSAIKESRHLAGKPYKEMSDDEGESGDSILKTCHKALKGKRSDMREIVVTELASANSIGMDLSSGLTSLESELASAKD